MPHARQTASSLRIIECPLDGDVIVVQGLPYGHAVRRHALRGLSRAGRVTVIVDDHDIDILLVRDPHDGALHPMHCLMSRESRLDQLVGLLDTGPAADHDDEMAPPRLRPAA